jgi:hypothetical protein
MRVITKAVSLIDTVRYRNCPNGAGPYIYIYALWADSLGSSGACNGHVNRYRTRVRVANITEPFGCEPNGPSVRLLHSGAAPIRVSQECHAYRGGVRVERKRLSGE